MALYPTHSHAHTHTHTHTHTPILHVYIRPAGGARNGPCIYDPLAQISDFIDVVLFALEIKPVCCRSGRKTP